MVELVILDVNETLFPLDPVEQALADIGLPGVLDVWFARVLRDGFAHAAAGTLGAFPDLARHHLAVLLEERGLPVEAGHLDRVLDAFDRTQPHPDVPPALRRMTERGVTVTTMTNGTVGITRDFLERAGLADLVAATHDVSMAGVWKPAANAYRYVLDRHGVEASGAALVAVHPWDLHGAAAVGLTTGWVDRDGDRYPSTMSPPDVTGGSMLEVVEGLLGRDG